MNSARSNGSALRYILRVAHIALWMTIPTTIWLWLVFAESSKTCWFRCEWLDRNVLGVSGETRLFIIVGLFLSGLSVYASWIAGYCLEITSRVIRGDRMLPSAHRGYLRQGGKLLWYSLGFWAPAIFVFICVCLVFDAARSEFTLRATWHVLALTLAIMPVILWGNLVGIARYSASGERSLIYRRRENIRLALTNLMDTVLLTLSVFALAVFSAAALLAVAGMLTEAEILDLVAEAALGSFVFFFILLCFCFLCSHLFAGYAKRIARCDNRKSGAKLG